ncbi:MAG: serine/threonine protein kinase [Deltaproteobacteria bacterium]|nr:serine/threonine protein kinase [Deltaproteobacteria bacterium]
MSSIHQRRVAPPAGSGAASQTLPEHLVQGALTRLRVTTIAVLGAALLRLLVPFVTGVDRFGAPGEVLAKSILFGGVALASAVLLIFLLPRGRPGRALLASQVWLVAVVALIGAAEASSPWGDTPFLRGIPLACVFLLVYPVVVPLAPRRFAVVAILAIATTPIGILLMPSLVGFEAPGPDIVAMALLPLAVCAFVGWVVAGTIYGLGKQLKKAEMAGSYQLVAPLGKGGMGEVWRARHGMLARAAAIKLIRRDVTGDLVDEARGRFEQEARAVASLRCPNTIQLWDFGVTDDGALYYAMELLDGMDMDALVERHGAQPPERVVHLLQQACASLAEAHDIGIVHRDIKPANLFVTRLGRDVDVVKVLDFGLATRPVHERIADARATTAGAILGTPAYMAPEQVLGDPTIDGRADIYALGLVAWWLIAGRDTFQATSASQVMFAHVNVDPEPPSAWARTPIPPELDALVLACLAKRREDRPQSAEALQAALAAIPLEAKWTRERALAWWSERGGAKQAPARAPTPSALAPTLTDAPPPGT